MLNEFLLAFKFWKSVFGHRWLWACVCVCIFSSCLSEGDVGKVGFVVMTVLKRAFVSVMLWVSTDTVIVS